MLKKTILCDSCGGEYDVTAYAEFTVCPYCGSRRDFEGFKYKRIDYSRSDWAWVERITDCPKCRSYNMIYSDEKNCFVCLDCRYEMTEEWLSRSVLWHCDECGVYMNIQKGFDTSSGSWKCTNCHFENDVTEDNIL